jgi:hypothetical protein
MTTSYNELCLCDRPIHFFAILTALTLGLLTQSPAQQIPALKVLPPDMAPSGAALTARRTELTQERTTLHGKINDLNARCAAIKEGSAAEIACKHDQAELTIALNSHIEKSNDFNEDAQPALTAYTMLNKMDALAKKLGWSPEKQARLHKALHKLDFDGDPNATGDQIRRAWQDVLSRNMDADLVREASKGGGLGFPGAGTQTVHNDCTIFALANATGRPYGEVGATATELIREGEWRNAGDRANPQAAIEHDGLNGGEVVMLAESYGQAEVVSRSDFARTLNAGRPILLNVVGSGGNVNGGHEVVLTKTFQHDGETWFVMMDSYQGPQRRLFLSGKELNTMLQENGVAYRPEPGTTPALLR